MRGRRTVPTHTHRSFDIRPLGECPSCDDFHHRAGVTVEQIDEALLRVMPTDALAGLRLLGMLRELDPERHAQYVGWIGGGIALAEAVDDAMGDWPEDGSREQERRDG